MDNVPETRQKLSIFLSHSHKDIEKVRKLRDILEFLDCEPLMFYLKCLDEDNDELNTFIMREIEARNIFIYCRSKNSENSAWVQKELAYIRSLDSKRLYTVDIDGNLAFGMLGVLEKLTRIIRGNQVFLSCGGSEQDKEDARNIAQCLRRDGHNAFLPSDDIAEGFGTNLVEKIDEAMENGVFMPVITPGYSQNRWCLFELGYAVSKIGVVLPVLVGDAEMPTQLQTAQPVHISEEVTENDLKCLMQAMRFMA